MKRSVGKLGVVAAALLLGAVFAAPAMAWEEDDCRDECQEARKVCTGAVKAAFKVCRDSCGDYLEEAVARAKRICEAEELGDYECAKLLRKAGEKAWEACSDDCRSAKKRAKAVCKDARDECRMACEPPFLDCAEECRDDFASCREGLGVCKDDCATAYEEAKLECEEFISDVCDPDGYRMCIKEARQGARMCKESCHDGYPCGADLRECLGDCRPMDDEDSDSDSDKEHYPGH